MPAIGAVALKPYWQTSDGETVRVYHGHALERLAQLPDASVQCCVTSPPYWGTRAYDGVDKDLELGSEPVADCLGWAGAFDAQALYDLIHRVILSDHRAADKAQTIVNLIQHGQNSPCGCCYVCHLVQVFAEVKRVLRHDGTAWLNLGDSRGAEQLAPGNTTGVPWRVALALQAAGWVLRQDIIWSKPSPMTESVKDRCTKSHEYIFQLTQSSRYFCDMEAIKERASCEPGMRPPRPFSKKLVRATIAKYGAGSGSNITSGGGAGDNGYRNKRSVWTIVSPGYPGCHFATYPPALITPCILAGTSEWGACSLCGAPWERLVHRKRIATRPGFQGKVVDARDEAARNDDEGSIGQRIGNRDEHRHVTSTRTLGWQPTCECLGRRLQERGITIDATGKEKPYTRWRYESYTPLGDHPVRPCIVLDPFLGSGTTCAVALTHGRWSWGIELSEEYLQANVIPRIEGKLLACPATAYLSERKHTRRRLDLGAPMAPGG